MIFLCLTKKYLKFHWNRSIFSTVLRSLKLENFTNTICILLILFSEISRFIVFVNLGQNADKIILKDHTYGGFYYFLSYFGRGLGLSSCAKMMFIHHFFCPFFPSSLLLLFYLFASTRPQFAYFFSCMGSFMSLQNFQKLLYLSFYRFNQNKPSGV